MEALNAVIGIGLLLGLWAFIDALCRRTTSFSSVGRRKRVWVGVTLVGVLLVFTARFSWYAYFLWPRKAMVPKRNGWANKSWRARMPIGATRGGHEPTELSSTKRRALHAPCNGTGWITDPQAGGKTYWCQGCGGTGWLTHSSQTFVPP
jgi:hypothetical protein